MSVGKGDSAARAGAAAVLLACLGFFAVTTWHWPLVGDASLMHYVAFLTDHGMRPYRDIAEINMPGAFLVDDLVMHTLGGGSVAWRIFDLMLIGAGIAAMIEIAGPQSWFAGLWAGVLLGLIHGRDGIFDAGQRDFVIAVLMLVGFAALFRATRGGAAAWVGVFGLCAGCAATIKPTYILLGPAVLVALAWWGQRGQARGSPDGENTRSFAALRMTIRTRASYPASKWLSYGVSGFVAPLVAVTIWLGRMGSLADFARVSRTLVAYHASLAHRGLGYLLLHSIAPLLPLVVVWLVVVVAYEREAWRSWERVALAIGMGVGLVSYLAQAKGYPYQRYPLLALVLVVMGMDFAAAARRAGVARVVAWAAIAYGVLYLGPASAWGASRYDWRNLEFQDALVADLERLGGTGLSGQGLSGEVQCIDTIGGCQGALYRMRLVQSSGWMYDEFLFGAERVGVVAASRRQFWEAFEARKPRVVIVVDGLFPSGPAGFGKLALWPEFDAELERDYRIEDEVKPRDAVYWWARKDEPRSFRVYVRKESR